MQQQIENRFQQSTLAAPGSILVATDLTDTAYLIPHAIAQAKTSGAKITLVYAVPPSDVVMVEPAAIPYIDKTKILRDVRLMLLGVVRQIESQGISCDFTTRFGLPAQLIREELQRCNATRLIMGTHGRGKLGQIALGSVAHELISSVDVPVFAVGPHAHDVERVVPRRILHPVSLMGNYRESVLLAFDIAHAYGAELTLLHVLDRDLEKTINPERTVEWAGHALDALLPDTANPVPTVRTRVTSGRLVPEILKTAKQSRADWIVLGADGGIRFRPFQEGAACQVLAAADCPVLTLRHKPFRTEARPVEEVHFTAPL